MAGGNIGGSVGNVASSAPKTSAPTTSTPTTSTPPAPKTSNVSAPSQASTGSYQTQTTAYKPNTERAIAPENVTSSMRTEGGNIKPLEAMDADELKSAGVDTSEGRLDLPGQQTPSTPPGTTPDVDEMSPEELEDPELRNQKRDIDEVREEQEMAQANQQQQTQPQGPQPGDEVGPGQEVKADGSVGPNAMTKLTGLGATAAAGYFGGKEGAKVANDLGNTQQGQQLLGVVGKGLETVDPSLKQGAENLDEIGALDAAKDVLDTASKAMDKDIGGTIKAGMKAKKSIDDFKEKTKKKMIQIGIQIASYFVLFIVIVVVAVAPIIGGVMYLTDQLVEMYSYVSNAVGEFFEDISLDIINSISYQDMLNDTPGYNELSKQRQELIATALLLVGMPYEWGGKPTGPGLNGVPKTGLDCSGFVKWVYWTVLGEQPGFTGTVHIWGNTTELVEITKDELQPGDIGVRHNGESGHTGIYAGDGMWIHEAGEATGCVRNHYKNFTKFYRHKKVN